MAVEIVSWPNQHTRDWAEYQTCDTFISSDVLLAIFVNKTKFKYWEWTFMYL